MPGGPLQCGGHAHHERGSHQCHEPGRWHASTLGLQPRTSRHCWKGSVCVNCHDRTYHHHYLMHTWVLSSVIYWDPSVTRIDNWSVNTSLDSAASCLCECVVETYVCISSLRWLKNPQHAVWFFCDKTAARLLLSLVWCRTWIIRIRNVYL